jgi:hypothetical protein
MTRPPARLRPALARLLPLACLAFAGGAWAQERPPLDPSTVPARGARPEAFTPAGWKVALQVAGDLDGDGRADRVLHLVPRDTPADESDAPEAQALVILLAARGGGWRRAGVAPRLLMPSVPQWDLRLTVRRGVLIVGQHYGMATVWDVTHRFRLDAGGRFLLIGRDELAWHRPAGMSDTINQSENYLTGVRLVTTGRWVRGGSYREWVQRRRIPRARTTFGNVREWEAP